MLISKAKILFYCCLVFIFSIALSSLFLKNSAHAFWWFIITAFFIFNIFIFWQNKKIRFIIFLLASIFLALARFSLALPPAVSTGNINYYIGQEIRFRALVVAEPDERENNTRLTLNKINYKNQELDGKILIFTRSYPNYHYGDILEIEGKLVSPEPFNDFRYDKYLARYGIYALSYYPEIIRIEENQGNSLYALLLKFKKQAQEKININLAEPEASLARAIFLGDKKNIPDELQTKFSQAGISHIIAISGMHIGIITALLMVGLLGLGAHRKHLFYFVLIILWLYIFLVGAPASALRAGLMASLLLLAYHIGRLVKPAHIITVVATVLLLVNPRLLRDDIGWQLSFAAVLAIIIFYPPLRDYANKMRTPKIWGLRDIALISIIVQLVTWPIIAYYFSLVSLISPVTNVLVLWTLPFMVVLLLLGVLLSFIWPFLSFLFFSLAGAILKYIIFIAGAASSWPGAYLEIENFSIWWIYLYLIIILIFIPQKTRLAKKS